MFKSDIVNMFNKQILFSCYLKITSDGTLDMYVNNNLKNVQIEFNNETGALTR